MNEDDVRRLDVAMDQTAAVQETQRVGQRNAVLDVDGMILGTSVGSILNTMKFYISKVTNNLYFLNLAILFHDLLNKGFIHFL